MKDSLVKRCFGGDVYFENNPHVYVLSNQSIEYCNMSIDRRRRRIFLKFTKAVKAKRVETMTKTSTGYSYLWEDLYCSDEHIKELEKTTEMKYRGTLDVTPLSSIPH